MKKKLPLMETFHTGESWGASWGDMNGDLYPDIYVSNHNLRTGLLRNNGDGTFSNVVLQADLDQIWTSDPEADIHGGTWADFDNDGDQDLFATPQFLMAPDIIYLSIMVRDCSPRKVGHTVQAALAAADYPYYLIMTMMAYSMCPLHVMAAAYRYSDNRAAVL